MRSLAVVAAVNDERILDENLADSVWPSSTEVVYLRNQPSAAAAYNVGLDQTQANIVVFAHQDVYFPTNWSLLLDRAIDRIEQSDRNWGVIGVYGVQESGEHVGYCWSSGLGRLLGKPFLEPSSVVSIDELVLVVRRGSALRFDEELPGFHLYGTDIVQNALVNGLKAYVICAPVIHNSRRVATLAGAYAASYRYMRFKWRRRLPIHTTIVPITLRGLPLLQRNTLHRARSLLRRPQSDYGSRGKGREIAEHLGFEAISQRQNV